jgi:hypothetical protein
MPEPTTLPRAPFDIIPFLPVPFFYDENKISMWTSVYFSPYLWNLSYENLYNIMALTTKNWADLIHFGLV